MNSNFILLNKTQKTIEYYNKLILNFSKKEVVLKQDIEKTSFSLIRNLFAFNINDTERIKQKFLKDYLVDLSMLNFYTNISYSKKMISKHQLEVLTKCFIELKKITYGLIKKEVKE